MNYNKNGRGARGNRGRGGGRRGRPNGNNYMHRHPIQRNYQPCMSERYFRFNIPPPNFNVPPPLPPRPPSPLPGTEEYRQRNIQETSELIKRQLQLDGATSGNSLFFNPTNQSQETHSEARETEKDNNQVNTSTPSTRKKRKPKNVESYEVDCDVEEILNKIIKHISKLSYSRKIDFVNRGLTGYEVAVHKLQTQKRLELSRALRDMSNKTTQDSSDSDVINSIIPDIGIKIEDLPREVIARLSSTLGIQLDRDENGVFDGEVGDVMWVNDSGENFKLGTENTISGDSSKVAGKQFEECNSTLNKIPDESNCSLSSEIHGNKNGYNDENILEIIGNNADESIKSTSGMETETTKNNLNPEISNDSKSLSSLVRSNSGYFKGRRFSASSDEDDVLDDLINTKNSSSGESEPEDNNEEHKNSHPEISSMFVNACQNVSPTKQSPRKPKKKADSSPNNSDESQNLNQDVPPKPQFPLIKLRPVEDLMDRPEEHSEKDDRCKLISISNVNNFGFNANANVDKTNESDELQKNVWNLEYQKESLFDKNDVASFSNDSRAETFRRRNVENFSPHSEQSCSNSLEADGVFKRNKQPCSDLQAESVFNRNGQSCSNNFQTETVFKRNKQAYSNSLQKETFLKRNEGNVASFPEQKSSSPSRRFLKRNEEIAPSFPEKSTCEEIINPLQEKEDSALFGSENPCDFQAIQNSTKQLSDNIPTKRTAFNVALNEDDARYESREGKFSVVPLLKVRTDLQAPSEAIKEPAGGSKVLHLNTKPVALSRKEKLRLKRNRRAARKAVLNHSRQKGISRAMKKKLKKLNKYDPHYGEDCQKNDEVPVGPQPDSSPSDVEKDIAADFSDEPCEEPTSIYENITSPPSPMVPLTPVLKTFRNACCQSEDVNTETVSSACQTDFVTDVPEKKKDWRKKLLLEISKIDGQIRDLIDLKKDLMEQLLGDEEVTPGKGETRKRKCDSSRSEVSSSKKSCRDGKSGISKSRSSSSKKNSSKDPNTKDKSRKSANAKTAKAETKVESTGTKADNGNDEVRLCDFPEITAAGNVSQSDEVTNNDCVSTVSDEAEGELSEGNKSLDFREWEGSILVIEVKDDKVISGNNKGVCYLHDLKSGELIEKFQLGNLPVSSISYSSAKNDRHFYVGTFEGRLHLIDPVLKEPVKSIYLDENPVQCMDKNWGYFFIGSIRGNLLRFSISKSKIEDTVSVSMNSVLVVRAVQEGARKVVLIATRNSPIIVRDAMTGLLMRTMQCTNVPTVYTLLFHNNKVYCGTSQQDILVYTFQNGELSTKYSEGKSSGVVCMEIVHNVLFAGCYNGNIYAYNTKTNKFIASMVGPSGLFLSMTATENEIIIGTKQHNFRALKIPNCIKKEMI